MGSDQEATAEAAPLQRVRVPGHVVYRSFADEVVVLNLQTGKYHGLNHTAGRMLEVLEEVGEVDEAVARLGGEFDVPRERLEEDVSVFCRDLLARGLIETADV